MPPVTSNYWVFAVVVFAICGVFSLAIAAWLIRELAHTALARSAQEDVPQVLTALGGLLDKLSLLLPWSRRGRYSLSTRVPRDRTVGHTESDKDRPEGGPQ
jgi:hypothetical protein